MFEYIEGTEQFIPQQRSIVIDLGVMPDEEIQGIAEVKAFIMALKYSRSPLLFEKLPKIIGFFKGVGEARLQYLEFVNRYLECFVPEEMHKDFSGIIHREYELGDEAMKNRSFLWELGVKEGEDKGIKKGIEIGLKKGEDKGIKFEQQLEREKQRTSVVKMIKKGVLLEDISEFLGLPIDEIAELKKNVEHGKL